MREVQTFPNGNTLLFDHCNKFGFEGVVSKPSGLMLFERAKPQLGQDKVPGLEAHQRERHKLFEGPRKPEPTEAEQTFAKNEELARVLERLRAPRAERDSKPLATLDSGATLGSGNRRMTPHTRNSARPLFFCRLDALVGVVQLVSLLALRVLCVAMGHDLCCHSDSKASGE
jgi:hypothetical protein